MCPSNAVESIPPFVIKATAAASLGGLIFGYDIGVISIALPQLAQEFNLEEKQQEMIVSFLYIGCSIGAIGGGYLCDKYGRKQMILVTDIGFIIGATVLYSATEYSTLLVGRILMGCAVAISGVADVAYLHEISPIQYRGSIVSCNEACISAGFMISYLSGYGISVLVPNGGWRYMFLLGGLVAIVQLICMLYMPESPVWLRQKGRIEEANSAFNGIRGDIQNNFHFKADTPPRDNHISTRNHLIKFNEEDSASQTIRASSGISPQPIPQEWIEPDDPSMETSRKHHRQVIITIFLSMMQNFCGHPNVLNFAPQIFAQIGFDSEKGRLIMTSLVGVIKFATVCFTIKNVETYGRKYLILAGMRIIALSLFVLALAYALYGGEKMTILAKISATVAVFGVAAGYSISFGPLVWLIVSEIFPSSIRGRALGASSICSYASAALVSYTFLTVQQTYGLAIPFAFYFLLTVLSIIFADIAIPETAGKTPKDIHLELERKWCIQ